VAVTVVVPSAVAVTVVVPSAVAVGAGVEVLVPAIIDGDAVIVATGVNTGGMVTIMDRVAVAWGLGIEVIVGKVVGEGVGIDGPSEVGSMGARSPAEGSDSTGDGIGSPDSI